MTNSNQTALFSAFAGQADRIIAKNPNDKKYAKGIKKWANERTCSFFCDVLDANLIAKINPFAAVYRCAQGLDFIAGERSSFEKSTAVLVAVVASAKKSIISFTDARFIMGGTGSDDTQMIAGMSRARVERCIGLVNNGTVQTRVSSALGVAGFFTELGITRKVGAHEFEIINKNHPFIVAYASHIGKISDGEFELLLEDKKAK